MGALKNMLIDRDMISEEEIMKTVTIALQERIDGLTKRLSDIRNRKIDETSREFRKYFGTQIASCDLEAVLPQDFWSISDIMMAIEKAQDRLLAVWQDYYGAGEEENFEGQVCIFDICNIFTGELLVA